MILLSSGRIRNIISDCFTEQDIIITLRKHKIKYTFTTETGELSIKIPCKKGIIRVFRSCSCSRPFTVSTNNSPVYSVPVYHAD